MSSFCRKTSSIRRKARKHLEFTSRKQSVQLQMPVFLEDCDKCIQKIGCKIDEAAADALIYFNAVESQTRTKADSQALLKHLEQEHKRVTKKLDVYFKNKLLVAQMRQTKILDERNAFIFACSNNPSHYEQLQVLAQQYLKQDIK